MLCFPAQAITFFPHKAAHRSPPFFYLFFFLFTLMGGPHWQWALPVISLLQIGSTGKGMGGSAPDAAICRAVVCRPARTYAGPRLHLRPAPTSAAISGPRCRMSPRDAISAPGRSARDAISAPRRSARATE
jgi:hypothetical protein